MASESIITLYDAASTKGKPLGWNPFVSRARYIGSASPPASPSFLIVRIAQFSYALNFKGVPYKTVWLEYPDIEPTFRSIGAIPISPKPDGSGPFYTLPVIVDPSRRTPSGGPTIITDSWNIAEYLDNVYPSPGLLFPEGTKALQALFLNHVTTTLFYPIVRILTPPLLDFLNEASRP